MVYKPQLHRKMNLQTKNPGTFAEMPTYKEFNGERFRISYVNPDFLRNCTSAKASESARYLRKNGWNVRTTRVKYSGGYAYVLYERRSRKVATEMRKSVNALPPRYGGVIITQKSARRGG